MGDLVEVLRFLLRLSRSIPRSRLSFAFVIVAGVLSGLCNTGLLALVNTALTSPRVSTWPLIVGFLLLCLLLPAGRLLSRVLLMQLTNRSVAGLRLLLGRQILSTPLAKLETLGPARLLAILTEDVGTISAAFTEVPLLSMHLAILIGCLVYLGWLSWVLLVVLLVFIALGALSYQVALGRGMRFFSRARRESDNLFRHLRALTEGVKELKLHEARRRAFLSQVEGTTDAMQAHSYKGELIAVTANSWGQILFFLAVGLLVLGLPRFMTVSQHTLTGYALVVLYLITPLEFLLNSFPFLGRAKVSIDTVEQLGSSLTEPHPTGTSPTVPRQVLREGLEISALTYTYHDTQRAEEFSIGPIDFAVRPGEIVFLTGGNGSGKTTFAKLLVGLYSPASGEILLDGEPVTDENRESYRQWFSAVFQDFFVFDDLLGLDHPELDLKAREYLVSLQLDREVDVKGGQFSTVDLSQGQRKRLALLTAYLEDRPIYLFDEWAADQDPMFKKTFYTEILRSLRQRRKAVVVISHDDRYYDLADRIIKLENGKVVAQDPVAELRL